MKARMMNESVQRWQQQEHRRTFWEVVAFELVTLMLLAAVGGIVAYSVMGFLGLL